MVAARRHGGSMYYSDRKKTSTKRTCFPDRCQIRTRVPGMFSLNRIEFNSIHKKWIFVIPAAGQAVVTGPGVVPSSPRFLPSTLIAHRVQQSQCSSIFHRVLLTHALALPASQFVRKKKPPWIYTSMHSGGFELTKLTYTRLEDSLIRRRGDRQ